MQGWKALLHPALRLVNSARLVMSKKNARKPDFVIVWEFRVKPGKRRRFERVYRPDGDWAKFFRHGKGYIRTELIRDVKNPRRYLTLDFWTTRQAYLRLKNENRAGYQAIDDKCLTLTEDEP
jgi:heme-degrading monooxygenase HmoA